MKQPARMHRASLLVSAIALTAGVITAGGCATGPQGAFSGAGLGAATGAIIGSVFGSAGAGAAIGAAAGGLSGAVIGDQNERNARNSYNRRPYVVENNYYYDRSPYNRPYRHRDRYRRRHGG